MMMPENNLSQPWQALILTHRRAALVALMPAQELPAAASSLTQPVSDFWQKVGQAFSMTVDEGTVWVLESFAKLLAAPACESSSGDFKIYSSVLGAAAIGQTTTAEVLAKMYEQVLKASSVTDAQVSVLGVGVGPGSFTGLRLGCAFANGLQCGRKRQLRALQNTNLQRLSEAREILCGQGLKSSFWEQALPDVGDDEFAVPVTLMDFLYALLQWPAACEEAVLQPAYGRLPGPVLKLQAALRTLKDNGTPHN